MKKRSKIFLFIFFLLVPISFFFAGAYAHKYGYIGIVRNTFKIVPNFVSGKIGKFNLEDKKIYIEIEDSDLDKLYSERKKILSFETEKAIIETYDDNGQFINAKLNFKNKTFKAKLALGGKQHGLAFEDKWPFRIKLENNQTLLGVSKFVLYHPGQRNYIFEWLFHMAFQKENGISLYYDFVPVLLNNKYFGIYALEESFDKTMLKKNNRQNSPIIKLDMSLVRDSSQINDGNTYKLNELKDPIITFWQEKEDYKNDKIFKKNFIFAAKRLDGFRKGFYKTSDIFDIKKLASYIALCDLFQGQHALTDNNLILYFNPKTLLLEPISFESNSIDSILDLSIDISYLDKSNITLKRIFEDKKLIEVYINYLKYYSQKKFLDNFLSNLNNEMEKKSKFLNSEFYLFTKKTNILYKQQDFIKANLDPVKGIKVFYDNKTNESLSLIIANMQSFPIEILGLSTNNIEVNLKDKILLQGFRGNQFHAYKKFNFEIPANQTTILNSDLNKLLVKYKILGADKIRYENIRSDNYIFDEKKH